MTTPSAQEVQAILMIQFPEPTIDAAIADAELLTEDCGYTGNRLRSIVKFLAAHFLSSTHRGAQGSVASKNVDGVAYSFNTASLGEGLKSTSYGAQALLLDNNGCLMNIGKKPVIFKRI